MSNHDAPSWRVLAPGYPIDTAIDYTAGRIARLRRARVFPLRFPLAEEQADVLGVLTQTHFHLAHLERRKIPTILFARFDSGMRKSELGGLRWANVDLDAGKVRVVEQLSETGPAPEWGPTKTGKPRAIDIDRDTVVLLREHKRAQAELKMRNRGSYADFGLVFAKDWTEVWRHGETLGQPLQTIGTMSALSARSGV